MNFEEKITEDLGRQLAQHIDFELMLDVLIACGWSVIKLKSLLSRERSVDILTWCEDNTHGRYKYQGSCFIFEQQRDAVNFALKWS
jgi:hypothetical protein